MEKTLTTHIKKTKRIHGFTLVEVMFAMGIVAFSLVSLLGLFVLGLDTSKESVEEVEAANVASNLDAYLRSNSSLPASVFAGISFANVGSTDATFTAGAGILLNSSSEEVNDPREADFLLNYEIVVPPDSTLQPAHVYLVLSWPPQATLANAQGKYEYVTQVIRNDG